METPRNILLDGGPWVFHLLPKATAGGHSKENLFQAQGKDKSEKGLFFIDQACLRDANSELVRLGNFEVGGLSINCTNIPRGTEKLALTSQHFVLKPTACLAHQGFPSAFPQHLPCTCFSHCWKIVRPKDSSVEREAPDSFLE